MVTLGLCSGLVVHTTAVAFGVAAIFQSSEMAFNILKAIGAIYLLYLAWQAFRASNSRINPSEKNTLTLLQLYQRGVIMNITNPKVTIFFLAFLPQFVSVEAGGVTTQIFLLGLIFIAITLTIFSSIALLSGAIGDWFNRSDKAQIYLNRVAGIVFVALATKLLLSTSAG